MKSRNIKLIIIFTALSLAGLIITQAYWVKKAINISQSHFEHRAFSALHSTIEEIKRSIDTNIINQNTNNPDSLILQVVKPAKLDSLLNKYCNYNKINNNFEFAIVKSKNDSVVFSTIAFNRDCPSEKKFKHCLSCIYDIHHYHTELIFPDFQKAIVKGVWNWLALSVIFMVIIIFCFGFIIFTIFRQKKLSEMKTDFINNMTHEFKTPISTISLASEILVNSNSETHIEKIQRYSKIIFEENQRMRSQVDQVLRMAQLDKGEYEVRKEETDIHELIRNTVNNLCFEHCEPTPEIIYYLKAKNPVIIADPLHLTNIIKNLVENAYKYSPDNPQIEILTTDNNEGITISVKDNGMGIESDKHKLIFDKFYRVPTGDVHNVKGFGIGLYYVKVLTEAHGGNVSVKSELSKGSRFDVYLPRT